MTEVGNILYHHPSPKIMLNRFQQYQNQSRGGIPSQLSNTLGRGNPAQSQRNPNPRGGQSNRGRGGCRGGQGNERTFQQPQPQQRQQQYRPQQNFAPQSQQQSSSQRFTNDQNSNRPSTTLSSRFQNVRSSSAGRGFQQTTNNENFNRRSTSQDRRPQQQQQNTNPFLNPPNQNPFLRNQPQAATQYGLANFAQPRVANTFANTTQQRPSDANSSWSRFQNVSTPQQQSFNQQQQMPNPFLQQSSQRSQHQWSSVYQQSQGQDRPIIGMNQQPFNSFPQDNFNSANLSMGIAGNVSMRPSASASAPPQDFSKFSVQARDVNLDDDIFTGAERSMTADETLANTSREHKAAETIPVSANIYPAFDFNEEYEQLSCKSPPWQDGYILGLVPLNPNL